MTGDAPIRYKAFRDRMDSDRADYSRLDRPHRRGPRPRRRRAARPAGGDARSRRRAPRRGRRGPPLGHWLFFLPERAPVRDRRRTGIRRRGGFLPPVHELPRRMWAGSRLSLPGQDPRRRRDRRRSTIASVKREGRRKRARWSSSPCATRSAATAKPPRSSTSTTSSIAACRRRRRSRRRRPSPAQWRRTLVPDAVLLFRYSALTFNGHRIHYDRDYVTEGRRLSRPGRARPADRHAARRPDPPHAPQARIEAFAFRAVSPLFDGNEMSVNADAARRRRRGEAVGRQSRRRARDDRRGDGSAGTARREPAARRHPRRLAGTGDRRALLHAPACRPGRARHQGRAARRRRFRARLRHPRARARQPFRVDQPLQGKPGARPQGRRGGRGAEADRSRKADVFVQNLAPGAVERLGLGPAELRAGQPAPRHLLDLRLRQRRPG